MKKRGWIVPAVFVVLLFSCKKEKNAGNPNPPDPGTTREDLIKDTTIGYTRDIYLWYDKIPATFNARSYADPTKIMEGIRQYSIEPGFTQPVDVWSFAMKQSQWDNVSGGVSQDFGMIFMVYATPAGNELRIANVEPRSPAATAGVRRGWRITQLNNQPLNQMTNESLNNALFRSASTLFTFQKHDGEYVNATIAAATYQDKPIMLDSVYTVNARKVGYMVYNSFLGDSTETVDGFARVFNRFATENVEDVVIDLRYNGGGYVYLHDALANYLVNNSGQSGVMMQTVYNNRYSQYNRTTHFSKKGSLNLSRIFFIVSQHTASASELLINNLKPYMTNTYIIGPNKTNGKPVGYFAIPVGDWYIFPVSSRTVNKNGQGNYFGGFTLDKTVEDGLSKDWGDITESCLAAALKFIETGAFRTSREERPYLPDAGTEKQNRELYKPFNGMIFPAIK